MRARELELAVAIRRSKFSSVGAFAWSSLRRFQSVMMSTFRARDSTNLNAQCADGGRCVRVCVCVCGGGG